MNQQIYFQKSWPSSIAWLTCCLFLLTGLWTTNLNAQCTNTNSFGNVVAPTGATAVTISTCSFQSEYSTITSVVAGSRYVVTASVAGTYITMRFGTSNGQVVAAGVTPLQFTAPCSGTYFAHWNTNSACGTAGVCVNTSIACSSCGFVASQCTNTSSFGSITAPTVLNTPTTISTCSFQSEYSTISSVDPTRIYTVTGNIAGAFITIHSGTSSGPVVASGGTPLTFTPTVSGTYFAHWNTNSACGTASSCMTTTMSYIGNSPCAFSPPTIASFTPNTNLCAGGGQTVTITGTNFTGSTAVTFNGVNAASFVVVNSTTITAVTPAGLTAGVINVTNPAGNANSAAYTVVANPTVSVSPTSSSICSPGGTAVTLTAGGTATAFSWGPAAGLSATTGSPVNALPTATTTYTVTGTDGNSCTATATSVITVNNVPSICDLTATPASVCSGANSQLNVSGGTSAAVNTYTFSSGTGTVLNNMTGATQVLNASNDDTPTGAPAGIGFNFNFNGTSYSQYSVSPDGWILLGGATATSSFSNGVTLTSNIPKIYPYWDDLATGTTGNVKTLVTGTAPNRIFIVQWFVTIPRATTGPANSTFQCWLYECGGKIEFRYGAMGPGTMSASVGLTGSASNFQSITISPLGVSTVTANDFNSVQPASGSIYTFTTPSPTWSWSPATFLSATNIANPVATGVTATTTYTVTATGAGGCTSTSTVTITAGAALSCGAILQSPTVICSGTNFTLTANPTGGGAPYTYLWSDASTTASITQNLAAGSYNYTVTVSDNCGATCSTTISVTVNQQPTASVTPAGPITICSNDAPVLLTSSTNVGSPTYLWSNGSTNATLNVTTTGNYSVIISQAGCSATSNTVAITVNPSPTVAASATPSTVPCNTAVGLSATPPPACVANYTLSSIPFAPVTGTPTAGPTGDDNVSAPINIGFNFPFYCNTKTQLIISTNGFISFDLLTSNGCCSGQSLPNASSPNDIVALCWTDLFVGTGSTDYFNLTSPNRFVIRFNGVQHCCSGPAQVDAQIILYEDGTIEIHNTAITANGTMTQGIENATGTVGTAVTGRNATSWSATADAFRFTPQVTTTYSWSPTLNMTGATTTNPTVSSISANTTYTVTATNQFGCTSTATAAVTFNPVVVNCSGTNNVCFGGNTGTASVSASGGTPGYTYLWSNSNTNSSISGLTAGTYCVTVTDAGGCTGTCCYTVTQPTQLTATAVATDASCPLCPDGTVSINSTSGGTPGYTFTNLTGLLPGNYCITVTDANGCTTSACATVGAVGCNLNVNATGTPTSCFGGNNGTATAAPTGGINGGPYTYSWSTGASTAGITGLTAGNYTVVVSEPSTGCVAQQAVTITQPTAVTASCSGTNTTCNGGNDGTASVTASGGTPGYTYLWSTTAVTSSISGLTAGNYTVTVTDANGCTATCVTTITQPVPVVASCSGTNVTVCATNTNGSASVVGSNGVAPYTYLWNTSASSSTITGLGIGTYCVTVTDANGCTATCCYTVTGPPAIVTTSAVTNICTVGGTGNIDLSASGGTPFGNINYDFNGGTQGWTTGVAGNLCFTGASLPSSWGIQSFGFTGTSYGTTSVGGEHTFIQSPIIPLPATLSLTAKSWSNNEPGYSYPSCTGYDVEYVEYSTDGGTTWVPFFTSNQANLHGSNMSVWNTLSYTATITPTANGRIRFRYDNADGCCGGSGVNNGWYLDDVSIAQPAGYNYLWSNGATTQDLTGVAAGTYTVIVTDANGCTSTASYTIYDGAMTLSATQVNVDCQGANTGSIDLTVTGGTTPYAYAWSNGATTQDISGLIVGVYTVNVTEANGCSASYTVSIVDKPLLQVTETHTDVLCNGNTNGTIDITATNGKPAYGYLWSDGVTAEDRTGLAPGTYTVTVTDQCGTSQILTIVIGEPTVLSATCSLINNVSCNGGSNGSVSVVGSGGTPAYTISPSTTGLAAGTYTFMVTDANGCTATCVATITQPSPLLANTSSTAATCINTTNGSATSAPSGGTPPYTYLWSNGSTNATAINLAGGTYTVLVTDANGCTVIGSATITAVSSIPAQPGAITGNVSVCLSSTGNVYSIVAVPGATSYTWSTGSTTATITSGQGSTSIQVSFSGAAVSSTISVTANNVCGSSIARFKTYKVTAALTLPGPIAGQTTGLCKKLNVPYSIAAVPGAISYFWAVPAGVTIVSGQGSTAIVVNYGNAFTGTGNITVQAVNSCTMSSARLLAVSAKAAKPVIIGSNTTCQFQTGVPYSVTPVLGATSYTWTVVSGSSIVSGQGTTSIIVNWGNINGVIKCKANNLCGSGVDGTLPVSFTCKEDGTALDISELALYPNPTDNLATLDFDAFVDGNATLIISDMIGRVVSTENFDVTEGNNKRTIDVNQFAKGTYLVKVSCEGSTRIVRLMVQ